MWLSECFEQHKQTFIVLGPRQEAELSAWPDFTRVKWENIFLERLPLQDDQFRHGILALFDWLKGKGWGLKAHIIWKSDVWDISCQRRRRRRELVRVHIIVSYQGYIRVFRERMCSNRCTMSVYTWHMTSHSLSSLLLLVWSPVYLMGRHSVRSGSVSPKFSLFQLFSGAGNPLWPTQLQPKRTPLITMNEPHSSSLS